MTPGEQLTPVRLTTQAQVVTLAVTASTPQIVVRTTPAELDLRSAGVAIALTVDELV